MLITTNDNNNIKFPNLVYDKVITCNNAVDTYYLRFGEIIDSLPNNTLVKLPSVSTIYSSSSHQTSDIVFSSIWGAVYILKKNNRCTIFVNTSLTAGLSGLATHNTANIRYFVLRKGSDTSVDLTIIKLQ